jgi:3',5'-cyclic AMP phosphodiesterase CpdA
VCHEDSANGVRAIMKFLHLSDIHVGKIDFDWAHDYIMRLREASPNDTTLIVTGDITDDGSEDQYKRAYDLFVPWEGHVLFVPGNHDFAKEGVFYNPNAKWRWIAFEGHFRRQFLRVHKDWQTANTVSDDTCHMVYGDGYHITLITSVPDCARPPWAFARGEISVHTVELLERSRKRMVNSISLVALHHHPWSNDWFLQLTNHHLLTYATYGFVDMVLFGHMHQGPREWHVAFPRANGQNVKHTRYLFQRNQI